MLNTMVHKRNFEDYLGRGLSGNIYGKRSKIGKIEIGDIIDLVTITIKNDSLFVLGRASQHKYIFVI